MNTIKVWDLFVRIFHWALVAAVISQPATAESFNDIHARVGYLIIFLVLSRIVWGFWGSKYSKFKDFIYPPRDILSYLTGLFQKHLKRYIGHNPAGGAMVLVLLLFLLLTAGAGLKAYGEKGKGPLANCSVNIVENAYADDDHHDGYEHHREGDRHKHDEPHGIWKEIHEILAHVVIVLVIVHILGVAASSYVHRENLIWSMVTGRKNTPPS